MLNNSPLRLPISQRNTRRQNIENLRRYVAERDMCRASFQSKLLPPWIDQIVGSIAQSSGAHFDLVLLGLIASIAAADRGRHLVLTPDGKSNTLSVIIAVALESGQGKSLALAPFLEIFKEWQKLEEQRADETKDEKNVYEAIRKEQRKLLIREAAQNPTASVIQELLALEKNAPKPCNCPQLLTNDVTSAAYSILLARQGYAIRLEPDGGALDYATYRQLTKYWAGESHVQSRASRDNTVVKSPFVVDLVFTQPKFYQSFMQDENNIAMGLIARALVYSPVPLRLTSRPPKEIPKATLEALHSKLFGLLNSSAELDGKRSEHVEMRLSADAAREWNRFLEWSKKELQNSFSEFWRVKEWLSRAPQHALRVAGIFHLAESHNPGENLIDVSTLEMAIDFIMVVAQHIRKSRFINADDQICECIANLLIWIMEHNFQTFTEKEIKYPFHTTYKANLIDIALFWLHEERIIDIIPHVPSGKGGRPFGREFINNLFEQSR